MGRSGKTGSGYAGGAPCGKGGKSSGAEHPFAGCIPKALKRISLFSIEDKKCRHGLCFHTVNKVFRIFKTTGIIEKIKKISTLYLTLLIFVLYYRCT